MRAEQFSRYSVLGKGRRSVSGAKAQRPLELKTGFIILITRLCWHRRAWHSMLNPFTVNANPVVFRSADNKSYEEEHEDSYKNNCENFLKHFSFLLLLP